MSALSEQDTGQKEAFLLGLLMLIEEYHSFIHCKVFSAKPSEKQWQATVSMKHSSLF